MSYLNTHESTAEVFAHRPADICTDEWQVRVDLAAAYRLVAHFGWDDLIFTHLSARVPGGDHHFLINPYGMMFHEITASSLVKVDQQGTVVADNGYGINPAGFTIHSAVHMAREEAGSVMHLHNHAGTAVSAQKCGLLPITQTAMLVHPHIAYHDYEGVALNLDERERIVRDLGDKPIMILRNHGTLTIGRTVAEAFTYLYFLENACEKQIRAQAGGELYYPSAEAIETTRQQSATLPKVAPLVWPGLIRLLDSQDPSYRT
jgi:ribulose-5-phosphate 4-epimerase/fuculose-1-phosphate aldolase